MIVSKKQLADCTIEIITEKKGIDGNDRKAAIIRHTYLISSKQYVSRKEVQFVGETNWIMHNEYRFSRS